jgi:predicted nucleotidyltransferase
MMKNLTPEMKKELFPENLILMGYRGSVAHNMYIPNTDPNSIDDIDLMGVFMAPVEHYIGITKTKETVEKFIGKYDFVSYELIKFVKLLLKSNPNVLSLLWIKDNHYIERNIYGKLLLENRELFISKKAYNSYIGYATSQLLRMASDKSYAGYMGNKRKKLVDRYGFDTKMASHAIRLLRMGIEYLETGKMEVYRISDAKELIDIKLGKWSKKEVLSCSTDLFIKAKKIYEKSPLPTEPNYKSINDLVSNILFDYIGHKFKSKL